MALLEFARRRPPAILDARPLPNRAVGGSRQQSRVEVAAEVGKTMLILMLIAFGIVALQYVLVFARGFLH